MDDNTSKRLAEQDYQRAKQTYKQARKAAGKSNKGKVIGIILLIIVSFLAGAFVMWTVGEDVIPFENPFAKPATTQQSTSAASAAVSTSAASSSVSSESSSSSEAAQSTDSASSSSEAIDGSASSQSANSGESASSSAASSESSTSATASSTSTSSIEASSASASSSQTTTQASGSSSQYVGSWKGTLAETINTSTSTKRCYAATDHPIELVIDSIETTGRVKAHAKVLIHGHDLAKLDRDIDSDASDKVVEFKDLTATYENGSFEFVTDTASGEKVVISVVKEAGAAESYTATVICGSAKDVYTLKKD